MAFLRTNAFNFNHKNFMADSQAAVTLCHPRSRGAMRARIVSETCHAIFIQTAWPFMPAAAVGGRCSA